MSHVAVIWSWLLTQQNNLHEIFLDWCLSIFFHEKEIEIGDNVTAGCSCGLAFETGFPVTLWSNALKGNGFWRFGYVFVNSVHNSNPKKLFGLEIKIGSRFQYRNVLDEDRPSHPRRDRFSCFRESTLSLVMLLHFEENVYSRHRFFISSGPSSSSSVMKNCPFSTIKKTGVAAQFWTVSDLQEVVRTYVDNLAAGFLQLRVGVRISNRKFCRYVHWFQVFIRSKFPCNLWNLWIIICTNLLLLRRYWADLQK